MLLAAGYRAGAASQSLSGITLAAILVGGGFAFVHPTFQPWATEVAPEALANVISFFAAAFFVGSSLATTVAAPVADVGSYSFIFVLASLTSVPLGLLGCLACRRYARK